MQFGELMPSDFSNLLYDDQIKTQEIDLGIVFWVRILKEIQIGHENFKGRGPYRNQRPFMPMEGHLRN